MLPNRPSPFTKVGVACSSSNDTNDTPGWFQHAVGETPERFALNVQGCSIQAFAWGDVAHPTIVLVHGGAAHAGWWSFVAPLLSKQYRVVAVDLSGHGDSEWRDRYTFDLWVDEAMAAAENAGGPGSPVIAGHSMGGVVAMWAVARRSADLTGAIIIDAPATTRDPETVEGLEGSLFRKPKSYPTLEAAVEHFHLVPDQPQGAPWLIDHVARSSLRRGDGGWTWKFDPRVFVERDAIDPEVIVEGFGRAACPVAALVGARSTVVDEHARQDLDALLRLASGPGVMVEIPEAYHHIMFDRPLELVTSLRTLLSVWHNA